MTGNAQAQSSSAQSQSVSQPVFFGLELSPAQRRLLAEHCVGRIHELANEMGRGRPGGCLGWMGRRERWLRQYQNEWGYRKFEEGGVFQYSNYSMNFAKRVCTQLTARTNREFFGAEPFFAVVPEEAGDAVLADRINRRSQWKFSASNAKSALREAVKYAYILGERVVKISFVHREKAGTELQRVWVDEEGEPVLTVSGHCVTEEDWVEMNGVWVCGHDPSLEWSEEVRYEWRPMERRKLVYRGPHLSGVHFRDFLCPLNVSDIHEADFICHLYDQPAWSAAQMYGRLELSGEGAGGAPKSQLAQAAAERGEEPVQGGSMVQVAECYLKADVNGDGLPEDVCAILTLSADAGGEAQLVFADYCANILPNGRWPFEVVRRNPDEGRWYGVGVFEEFSHKQDFIDLHFNRINFRNMTTGTVKFWRSRDVEEEREPFSIGDDKVWTPRENADPEKIFTAVPLLEPTAAADLVLQYMMQSFQLEAGVSAEGEGRMAGLASSETATGVLSNERTADDLTHSQMCDLEDGLAKAIRSAVLMDYYHMDPIETFAYLEGDTAQLEQLTRSEVENLSMNVRLLLTKRRSQQTLAANSQAIKIVENYIALLERVERLNLPVQMVSRARSLFVQALKSLEIQGAEEILLDPARMTADSEVES